MAVQAPNTRLDPRRPLGLQERIRALMSQRSPLPEEQRPDLPFRFDPGRDHLDDPTQRIVRTAQPDQAPTADEILQEESPRTLGGVVGAFEPSPASPAPIPKTPEERIVELRDRARRQADAMRSRVKTGPAMTVDGEPEPDLALPDPKLEGNFTPKPAALSRTPKPGATQTGGYYVAPGRADAAGRAVGKSTREEREKAEQAAAEKAKNEADLAAKDAQLDSWAAGEDGEPGTEDDNMLFKLDPDTGEWSNTGRDHPNKLDEHGRRTDRPQGTGTMAWTPAAPGTGYRARVPGQPRREATPEERATPPTARRLPDAAGNSPPMMPGRGQSVVRGSGFSPAAPQQGIVDNIPPHLLTPEEPKDQGQFFQWREAMKQLAMAAGVNVAVFESEEDLVREGVKIAEQLQRMEKKVTTRVPKLDAAGQPMTDVNGNVITTEQQTASPKYERRRTSTGAPVFIPSDAMRKKGDDSRRRAAARQFVDQHKPDEQTGVAIIQAADAGDWDTVDSLVRGARATRRAGTAQAAMDQSRLRGQTQQMNNPRINEAMFHEAIMNQPNAAGVNQVRAAWGIPEGARGMVAAEAAAAEDARFDRKLENDLEVARVTADGRKDPVPPDPADYIAQANAEAETEIKAGVDGDWASARARLRQKYSQKGSGRTEADADYAIAGMVMRHVGDVNHPAVTQALQTLYANEIGGFLSGMAGAVIDATMREEWDQRRSRFLAKTREMGIPDERAERFLNEKK